jgi:hypothetical protein
MRLARNFPLIIFPILENLLHGTGVMVVGALIPLSMTLSHVPMSYRVHISVSLVSIIPMSKGSYLFVILVLLCGVGSGTEHCLVIYLYKGMTLWFAAFFFTPFYVSSYSFMAYKVCFC